MNLAVWPAGVRDRTLTDNYQPLPPKQLAETTFQRGHKLRRTATGTPEEHRIRLRLPVAEFLIFENWFKDSAGNPAGSRQFMFPHPRSRQSHLAQIIPEEGRPYTPSLARGKNYFVDMKLRIYP